MPRLKSRILNAEETREYLRKCYEHNKEQLKQIEHEEEMEFDDESGEEETAEGE
jgi:hypothetical protein